MNTLFIGFSHHGGLMRSSAIAATLPGTGFRSFGSEHIALALVAGTRSSGLEFAGRLVASPQLR
jgi:hypothetical protein